MRRDSPSLQSNLVVFSLPRTAVFIDGDWLLIALTSAQVQLDYRWFAAALRDYWGNQTSIFFYVSSVGGSKINKSLLKTLSKEGYEIRAVPSFRTGPKTHSPVDVTMAADMGGLPIEYDRVVLISGDSDFAPALESARDAKRTTTVVAFPLVTGRALLAAADRFVSLDNFLQGQATSVPTTTVAPREVSRVGEDNYFVHGHHLEPYLLIRQLFNQAKRQVMVVDMYLDEQILLLIQLLATSVSIELFTYRIPVDFCTMVKRLRKQGYSIGVHRTKDFHDRFLQIDGAWWHSGHSFKDLGNKDSRLSRVSDPDVSKRISARIAELLKDSKLLCS